MKKKYLPILALVLFLVLALGIFLVWQATRPQPAAGGKHVTVEVVHKDGSTKEFAYDTDAEYLSEVLLDAGLISGSDSAYGLMVDTVDGEVADYTVDGSYWALYVNGAYAETGVSSTPVQDGDAYTWAYTVG